MSPDVILQPYASQTVPSRLARGKPVLTPGAARGQDRVAAKQTILEDFFPQSLREMPDAATAAPPEAHVPLRSRRVVRNWQGHWIRCDSCNVWRRVSESEHGAYGAGAFQCGFIRLRCRQ